MTMRVERFLYTRTSVKSLLKLYYHVGRSNCRKCWTNAMMSYDRKASGGTEPAERARRLGTMHMVAVTEAAVDLVSLAVTRSGTLQQRGGGFRAEPIRVKGRCGSSSRWD